MTSTCPSFPISFCRDEIEGWEWDICRRPPRMPAVVIVAAAVALVEPKKGIVL